MGYEYSAETDKAPEQIWARYRDHRTWPDWDHGLESVELHGLFRSGTSGRMKPRGQGTVEFTVIEVEENKTFTDECRFGGIVMRFPATSTSSTRATPRSPTGWSSTARAPTTSGHGWCPPVTAEIPELVAQLVKFA